MCRTRHPGTQFLNSQVNQQKGTAFHSPSQLPLREFNLPNMRDFHLLTYGLGGMINFALGLERVSSIPIIRYSSSTSRTGHRHKSSITHRTSWSLRNTLFLKMLFIFTVYLLSCDVSLKTTCSTLAWITAM